VTRTSSVGTVHKTPVVRVSPPVAGELKPERAEVAREIRKRAAELEKKAPGARIEVARDKSGKLIMKAVSEEKREITESEARAIASKVSKKVLEERAQQGDPYARAALAYAGGVYTPQKLRALGYADVVEKLKSRLPPGAENVRYKLESGKVVVEYEVVEERSQVENRVEEPMAYLQATTKEEAKEIEEMKKRQREVFPLTTWYEENIVPAAKRQFKEHLMLKGSASEQVISGLVKVPEVFTSVEMFYTALKTPWYLKLLSQVGKSGKTPVERLSNIGAGYSKYFGSQIQNIMERPIEFVTTTAAAAGISYGIGKGINFIRTRKMANEPIKVSYVGERVSAGSRGTEIDLVKVTSGHKRTPAAVVTTYVSEGKNTYGISYIVSESKGLYSEAFAISRATRIGEIPGTVVVQKPEYFGGARVALERPVGGMQTSRIIEFKQGAAAKFARLLSKFMKRRLRKLKYRKTDVVGTGITAQKRSFEASMGKIMTETGRKGTYSGIVKITEKPFYSTTGGQQLLFKQQIKPSIGAVSIAMKTHKTSIKTPSTVTAAITTPKLTKIVSGYQSPVVTIAAKEQKKVIRRKPAVLMHQMESYMALMGNKKIQLRGNELQRAVHKSMQRGISKTGQKQIVKLKTKEIEQQKMRALQTAVSMQQLQLRATQRVITTSSFGKVIPPRSPAKIVMRSPFKFSKIRGRSKRASKFWSYFERTWPVATTPSEIAAAFGIKPKRRR